MSDVVDYLAEALDPVLLARRLGWEPDEWQAASLRSQAPRAALVCCRQAGKSQVAATKAVHVAAYEPGSLVLLVSIAQRQADELFKRVQQMWRAMGRPVPDVADNRRSLELENGSRIVSLPGDEGTVRGYAAVRLIVIDEAARVDDDVLHAFSPMLAVSRGGQLLAISTPWGRRGWFYEVATQPDLRWEITSVAAPDCPRISADFLAAERASMTDLAYRSDYLVEFVEGAGALFDPLDVDRMFTPGQPFDPTVPLRRLRAVTDTGPVEAIA